MLALSAAQGSVERVVPGVVTGRLAPGVVTGRPGVAPCVVGLSARLGVPLVWVERCSSSCRDNMGASVSLAGTWQAAPVGCCLPHREQNANTGDLPQNTQNLGGASSSSGVIMSLLALAGGETALVAA